MSRVFVDFRQIDSAEDLAFVLGTGGTLIRVYLEKKEQFLVHHRLPKRGGRGFRDVLQVRDLTVADCFKRSPTTSIVSSRTLA